MNSIEKPEVIRRLEALHDEMVARGHPFDQIVMTPAEHAEARKYIDLTCLPLTPDTQLMWDGIELKVWK